MNMETHESQRVNHCDEVAGMEMEVKVNADGEQA